MTTTQRLYNALKQAIPPLETYREQFAAWGRVGGEQTQALDDILRWAHEACAEFEKSSVKHRAKATRKAR